MNLVKFMNFYEFKMVHHKFSIYVKKTCTSYSALWQRAWWGRVWIRHSWRDLHEVETHPQVASAPHSLLHSPCKITTRSNTLRLVSDKIQTFKPSPTHTMFCTASCRHHLQHLRHLSHMLTLPQHVAHFSYCNFLTRVLHKHCYWVFYRVILPHHQLLLILHFVKFY